MSKQNKSNKTKLTLGPFCGIDLRTPHSGEASAADIVNFRIEKDGSLCKRFGFHSMASVVHNIHDAWSGKLFGSNLVVFLSGTYVMFMDPETHTTSYISKLPDVGENSRFCYYRDRLYLFGDQQIYQITEKKAVPVEAYVPLVGKNWRTSYIEEVHEPRNLLTRRARIEYVVQEDFSVFLRTRWDVESIEALYVDEKLLSADQYTYDALSKSIILQKVEVGSRIFVYLTYTEESFSEELAHLRSCSRVDVFGTSSDSRLFRWNGTQKNLFFPSTYVTAEALEQSQAVCPDSVPLYFPEHGKCILGDGRYDINGFLRQQDRLLIFTEGDTWMIDTNALTETKFVATPIHPLLGCTATGAYAMAENSPMTVIHNAVYEWNNDTDEYSECSAHRISEPIHQHPEAHFLSSAKVYHNRAHGEIWFYAPDLSATIWVYRIDGGMWYRFSGILADLFFEVDQRLYFARKNQIYAFDRDYCEDIDQKGNISPILASYTSNLLDYGTPRQKHFSGVWLSADCQGQDIDLTLSPYGTQAITIRFSSEDTHMQAYRRLTSGRFQHATIQITANGNSRQVIHSLISEVR